jgi:predicted molibdopterin-dependent oxidoreductase YjgC
MFKRFNQKAKLSVKIEFDGTVVEAVEGDTVAGAIMAAGISDLREAPVSGAPRGPYCMMGVCFECLVEIDGIGHQQACLLSVKNGMIIKREKAKRLVSDDHGC